MPSHGRTRRYDRPPKPPYSRDGREEKFETILAAEDLEAYTHIKSRDKDIWPARERGGLPMRMVREAEDVYCFLQEANSLDLRIDFERSERLSLQRKALTKIKLLNHHIEFAHAKHWISDKEFDYWTNLSNECRKRAAGWYSSDKERAKKQEEKEKHEEMNALAAAIVKAMREPQPEQESQN